MSTKIAKTIGNRNTGLDALRCLAMCMVVVLHFLGKGKLLPDMAEASSWNALGIAAWLLESVCIVAVNVYMLISGYFLSVSHFKLSRLISLYVQLWFYSVGIGLLAQMLGFVPADEINTYKLLIMILPVSMEHYWFLTAYVFFYILLPLLGLAAKKLERKPFMITIVLLLIFTSFLKSVFPVALEKDAKGYDFLWYAVMFLIAAYIRKFEPKFAKRKISAVLFICGVLGTFCELLLIGKVREITGSLGFIKTISTDYNHIFPLIASVGLFGLFKDVKLKGVFAKVITFIAPYTLGVYLLHENIRVRYLWPNWLGAGKVNSVATLLLHTTIAVVVVFVVGITVDIIRKYLFKGINYVLCLIKPYKKVVEGIQKLDATFAGEKLATKVGGKDE